MIAPPVEKGPRSHGRWTAIALVAAGLVAAAGPAAAGAQAPPPLNVPVFGQFRSVLAQGEGQSITAADLAAYQATGEPPDSFVNQQPLYVGHHARTPARSRPATSTPTTRTRTSARCPAGRRRSETPHAGVQIYRDGAYGMAHIYGDNRYDADVRGGLRDRRGAPVPDGRDPAHREGDARRPARAERRRRRRAAAHRPGLLRPGADRPVQRSSTSASAPPGERTQDDILAYIDGINARIDEVKTNPSEMPAEYPALGATPKRWTVSDTAAMAVLLVTQFTVSNGGEEVNAQLQQAFRKRFGSGWRAPYNDLREAEDPEAYVVAKRPFLSDRPGPVKPGLNAMPALRLDHAPKRPGRGPRARSEQAAARAALPAWARSVEGLKASLPDEESNAVMVGAEPLGRRARAGGDGAAGRLLLAADLRRVRAPRRRHRLRGGELPRRLPVAPDRPRDRLRLERHERQRRQPGHLRRAALQPRRLAADQGLDPLHLPRQLHAVPDARPDGDDARSRRSIPSRRRQITYRTMRSVHGPVFAFARVDGQPVALTKAKAVDFHELNAAVSVHAAVGEPRPPTRAPSCRSWASFPGTENWFYVDHRNVAFHAVRALPAARRRAPTSTCRSGATAAPTGRDFNPRSTRSAPLPASHRPRARQPGRRVHHLLEQQGGDRAGARARPSGPNGPVHRAMILQKRLFDQVRRQGGGRSTSRD